MSFCRLFAGFVPRVIWIFLGGGIFFGVYEVTARLVDEIKEKNNQNSSSSTSSSTKLNAL